MDCSTIIFKECLGWGAVDVELNRLQNFGLKGTHVLWLERVLGHLDEVRHDGRINFLKFACNEHRSDSKKLELVQRNPFFTQVPINYVHCDEERFR